MLSRRESEILKNFKMCIIIILFKMNVDSMSFTSQFKEYIQLTSGIYATVYLLTTYIYILHSNMV